MYQHFGPTLSTVPPSTLLTRQQVLCRILGLCQDNQLKNIRFQIKTLASTVSSELIAIWEKAAFPTIRIDKIISKLLNTYDELKKKLKS